MFNSVFVCNLQLFPKWHLNSLKIYIRSWGASMSRFIQYRRLSFIMNIEKKLQNFLEKWQNKILTDNFYFPCKIIYIVTLPNVILSFSTEINFVHMSLISAPKNYWSNINLWKKCTTMRPLLETFDTLYFL